jgi:hypothetical protein
MAGCAPLSTDEALAMLHASLDHLAEVDWQAEGGRGQGPALRSLGAARSKWTVAHGGALTAFGSGGGYVADGQLSVRTWLRHQAKLTKLAARGPGQRNHDALEAALRLALGAPGTATRRTAAGRTAPARALLRLHLRRVRLPASRPAGTAIPGRPPRAGAHPAGPVRPGPVRPGPVRPGPVWPGGAGRVPAREPARPPRQDRPQSRIGRQRSWATGAANTRQPGRVIPRNATGALAQRGREAPPCPRGDAEHHAAPVGGVGHHLI